MEFDQACNRGIITAYELSFFTGLGTSLLTIPVAVIGLISGIIRKKPVLYPLLAGIAGIAYVLCLVVIPVIQSLNERDKAESQINRNNSTTSKQHLTDDVTKTSPQSIRTA